MKNKFVARVLTGSLALLAVCNLAACKSTKKTDAETTVPTSGTTAPFAETTVTNEINPALPEKDFGGYEFKILSRWLDNPNWTPVWDPRDIAATEENGEPINDAVYLRNQLVEEKFNVKITEVKAEWISQEFNRALTNNILSGDFVYDVFYDGIRNTGMNIPNHYFLDVNTLPYLDLDKPYWDQKIKEATIGNKLYLLAGDMTLLSQDATSAMVFNKQLISDYGFENPYDLVKSGKWTMDKLLSMAKEISIDFNGDGKMDFDDMYGLIAQADSVSAFYQGSGMKILEKDENDFPVPAVNTPQGISVLEKVFDLMYGPFAVNAHKIENKVPSIYAVTEKMFMENRALFMWIRMRVVENLRTMDVDFGIVPLPKFSETQTEYYSAENVHTGQCLSIPITTPDLERTGILLEAMGSASQFTIKPAYYEVNLKGKFARDEESLEMLDIIFSSKVYDTGDIFAPGDIQSIIANLSRTDDRNFSSAYAKGEKKMLKDIEKLRKAIEEE